MQYKTFIHQLMPGSNRGMAAKYRRYRTYTKIAIHLKLFCNRQ